MQIFIDSYSDSNFNATNVWFQEDLREKYSRYQSYGVILIYIFFFLKNSYNLKKKRRGEYFKKNNPRRDASITFLIIENRACYTFTFHVSRMQLVKPNVRPCKKKRAASFFHPGEKKPLPLPSLSPQKKRKEKNQTAEPTL